MKLPTKSADVDALIPACIYARFSTERQSELSLEDQIHRCREYAARLGYRIVQIYTDAAISGTHTERPGLQSMLADAKMKPRLFRAVIIENQSRLSRDLYDKTGIIFRTLARVGVKVLDTSGFDSTNEDADLSSHVSGIVDSQFVKQVSKMTHRGLDGRARNGFSTGGSLFGYQTVREENVDPERARKVWQIDENEAPTVRRIYKMFADGMSYKAIADQLNREGVECPRNNGRGGKHGTGWGHSTVRAILRNEKYIGKWSWNTTRWRRLPGERVRHREERDESEHVVREMPELAIVDTITWERVQSRMRAVLPSGLRSEAGRKPREGGRAYMLSGLLKCGTCGGPMSISGAKVKRGVRYATYGCTAHSSRGEKICPNHLTVSEKKVNAALVAALREILTGPEVMEAFARAFERRVNREATSGDDLHKQLAAAHRRVANATKLIVEDPDDLDLRRQREHDRAEVRRLEAVIGSQGAPAVKPDPAALREGISAFLDAIEQGASGAGEVGRAALLGRMTPLTVEPTPKTQKPGLVVTGSLSLLGMCPRVVVAGVGFEPTTFGL